MASKEVSPVGGGITQFKMSGDINWDIDKIYDASKYMVGLVDYLVEEMKARGYDTNLFIDATDVQTKARQMATCAERLFWEKKRKFGQL